MRNKIEILTSNYIKVGESSSYLNFLRSFYGHNEKCTYVITFYKIISLLIDVLSYATIELIIASRRNSAKSIG